MSTPNTILWKSENGLWSVQKLNGNVRGCPIIVVDEDAGTNDCPVIYDDNSIAYDSPERFPAYVKEQAAKFLRAWSAGKL